jgi:hypothetical protein
VILKADRRGRLRYTPEQKQVGRKIAFSRMRLRLGSGSAGLGCLSH